MRLPYSREITLEGMKHRTGAGGRWSNTGRRRATTFPAWCAWLGHFHQISLDQWSHRRISLVSYFHGVISSIKVSTALPEHIILYASTKTLLRSTEIAGTAGHVSHYPHGRRPWSGQGQILFSAWAPSGCYPSPLLHAVAVQSQLDSYKAPTHTGLVLSDVGRTLADHMPILALCDAHRQSSFIRSAWNNEPNAGCRWSRTFIK